MKSLAEELLSLRSALDRAAANIGFAAVTGRVQAEPLRKALDTVKAGIAALSAFVEPDTKPRHLNPAERAVSLVEGVYGAAKEFVAWRPTNDALQAAISRYAPEEARQYWNAGRVGEIYGNLRSVPEIAEQLEQRGGLCWVGKIDGAVRIVDTNWLTVHGDIRAFVTGPEPTGGRCRFCTMREPDAALELVAVEPEKRGALATGPRLQPATVYTHEKCRPYWLRWLAIAEQYATQAEAEAADRAAGREPRALTAPANADAAT